MRTAFLIPVVVAAAAAECLTNGVTTLHDAGSSLEDVALFKQLGVSRRLSVLVEGESLLFALRELAVSSGSACTSATREASYVLRALGRSDQLAQSSIRLSFGRYTSEPEIDRAVDIGVFEDDVGGFAAQLQRHRREPWRRRGQHLPADLGAAGEEDVVERQRAERRAQRGVAVQHPHMIGVEGRFAQCRDGPGAARRHSVRRPCIWRSSCSSPPLHFLAGGIEIGLHLPVVGGDVGLCACQPGMSQQLLDAGHRYVGADEIVGKGVTQTVDTAGFGYAGFFLAL